MINLFFSYAHQDEAMRDELEIHLAMLKRSGLISAWHDRRITAGAELDRSISQHLEQADVILLLLSPHFLASEYCYENEAQRALERHESGAAVVIPVIVQPCDWLNSPFSKLRATPKDGKAIAKYPNVNDAFLEVTKDIRDAAERLNKSDRTATVVHSPPFIGNESGLRSSNLRLKKTLPTESVTSSSMLHMLTSRNFSRTRWRNYSRGILQLTFASSRSPQRLLLRPYMSAGQSAPVAIFG